MNIFNRYGSTPNITKAMLENAWENVLETIDKNLVRFTNKFPSAWSSAHIYHETENTCWTNGFWTGMLWLAYEMTGADKYRSAAEIQVLDFKRRIDEKISVDFHDLGFLYTLSCVASFKLTGNETARTAALQAAEQLAGRFREKGEFIQAWGSIDSYEDYRLIVDCYLNLPLLYWAAEVTGDSQYYTIAYKHLQTATKYAVREDFSAYHTFYFDYQSGEPVKGVTAQGYSDHSAWARGQAWVIYGLALSYKYTQDKKILEVCKKSAQYFLNRLPEDHVCYWDLIFTSGNEERDSSAAAIAVCGMMELANVLDEGDPQKAIYSNASRWIMDSLMQNYTAQASSADGLLLHAVAAKPQKLGVDECCIWGDYYYMEALVRMLKDWEAYW